MSYNTHYYDTSSVYISYIYEKLIKLILIHRGDKLFLKNIYIYRLLKNNIFTVAVALVSFKSIVLKFHIIVYAEPIITELIEK